MYLGDSLASAEEVKETMAGALAVLRLGSPIQFRDRWSGHLDAFEVDDGWELLNVVARRGLIRASSVKLPFSAVSDWSDERVAASCTSDEAFGRQVPPLAVSGLRPLSARTPLTVAGARLAGALVDRRSRTVRHLLTGEGVAAVRTRKAPVEGVSFEAGRLRLGAQLSALPTYHSDADLLALVREALARPAVLTADDRRALTVDVADGTVRLAGNVRTRQGKDWAERVAASVNGTAGVRNEIVDDIELEAAVAHALDRAGLYRSALVHVRSSLGQLSLYGRAPSASAVEEVVRVASTVAGVRSVTRRLEVAS